MIVIPTEGNTINKSAFTFLTILKIVCSKYSVRCFNENASMLQKTLINIDTTVSV